MSIGLFHMVWENHLYQREQPSVADSLQFLVVETWTYQSNVIEKDMPPASAAVVYQNQIGMPSHVLMDIPLHGMQMLRIIPGSNLDQLIIHTDQP